MLFCEWKSEKDVWGSPEFWSWFKQQKSPQETENSESPPNCATDTLCPWARQWISLHLRFLICKVTELERVISEAHLQSSLL